MANSSVPFTNFTAGELSPRLDGRTDLAKYYNGCKKLQNFVTFPQGGVTRRSGTEHIAEAHTPTSGTRLIPFEFNIEQTYVLEFSNNKFRVYKDGGIVVDGNSDPIQVTTQYTSTQLAALKFTQSADTMYIVHPDHPPRQITRTDHDAWTITDIDFRRGPFLDPATDDSTLLADDRTGKVMITSSESNFWASTDKGRLVKLHHGYAKIIAAQAVKITVDNFLGVFTVGETVSVSGVSGTATFEEQGSDYIIVSNCTIASLADNALISNGDLNNLAQCRTNGAQSNLDATDAAWAEVQENDDLEEELEPSMTASTISFHEGDPDATGLAHNDFIEDSAGKFIDEGFKVGMRISATGSANVGISSISVSGSKITVTSDGPHNLINGDLIKLTGVTGLTVTFPSGATINDYLYEVSFDPQASTADTVFELLDPATRKAATASGTPNVSSAEIVNGNNFSNALIVAVTDSIITLSTSNDIHFQNEGQSITITGDLIADDKYQLGAFSDTTGYPACVAFFEQRLVFANTANQRQTIFFSVSGDYTNFTAGVAPDSAMIYTIGSNQVNVIRYLSSSRVLLVGTSGGEFAVRSTNEGPITPTTTQIKQQAKYGSADIQPIPIGSTSLFVQREQRKIRELVYNFDVDAYVAPDMTLLAEHITEGKVKEMAYQQEPNNVVWCVLENGKLAAMTYRREEDVVAWHEHLLGGTFTDGGTTYNYGFVESIATISSGQRTEEEVYLCVRRTIDGVNVRHIERLKPLDFGSDIKDAFYVDAGLSYDSPETTPAGSGFSSTATTITLDDASGFSSSGKVKVDSGSYFEVITYTGKSGDSLTGCTRGAEGTEAKAHGTNAEVTQFLTSLTGLGHLEGESVTVFADGSVHDNKTVSSGSITLDRSVTKAHVGLSYDSILQTMRPDSGGTEGTSQAKNKRISDVDVRVLNSVGIKIGPSESNLDAIPFRSTSMAMDTPIPLYTGDKFIEFAGGHDNDGFVVVKQDQPLPLTILSIYPRLQTFDR